MHTHTHIYEGNIDIVKIWGPGMITLIVAMLIQLNICVIFLRNNNEGFPWALHSLPVLTGREGWGL